MSLEPQKIPWEAGGHFPLQALWAAGLQGLGGQRPVPGHTTPSLSPALSWSLGGSPMGAQGPKGPGRLDEAGDRPDTLWCAPHPHVTTLSHDPAAPRAQGWNSFLMISHSSGRVHPKPDAPRDLALRMPAGGSTWLSVAAVCQGGWGASPASLGRGRALAGAWLGTTATRRQRLSARPNDDSASLEVSSKTPELGGQ